MALLDKGLKQRMVGALVLLALAVIFLPMLLTREDPLRQVRVDAPSMPSAPAMPQIDIQPVAVPEPEALAQEPVPEDISAQSVATPETPAPSPVKSPEPAAAQASAPAPAPAGRLDVNGLPVSWSVQLASLSSLSGAQSLQKTLRGQGYNAYIRSVDGMNRVFVGPLIERVEADRLRDQLQRQHKLNGFVVRFQPERS